MPELPEVETTRRGIAPHIEGKRFQQVIVRQPQLRWPVPQTLASSLLGQKLERVERRGKYLLLSVANGTLILHLGMSGNLRITTQAETALKHDHVDFVFDDGTLLRFNDQRRFGAVLWTEEPARQHPLLASLGPEPLSAAFDADYLRLKCQNRRAPLKNVIMDSKIVVGVGNIYANEALFLAGLAPTRAAETLDMEACRLLSQSIKTVLSRAIEQGGTTLRDFVNAQGKPGYFQQSLAVYGKAGQACTICSQPIQSSKIGQRATYYCPSCQR